MIEIKGVGKNYICCSSCNSNDEVFSISVGLSDSQTSTFRLCKKCMAKLIVKAEVLILK